MTETVDMQKYYNDSLKSSKDPYEHKRWFSSSEREAAYRMTSECVLRYATPHVSDTFRMLEVGAGPGTWTKQFLKKAPNLIVDIADISDEMLSQARKNLSDYKKVTYIQTDFEAFEPEHVYDFFFSSRAIEYMPNIDKVAATIGRSLKTGGVGCIITKYPHYRRAQALGAKVRDVHALQISPAELSKQLEAAGCMINAIHPVTFVFPKAHTAWLDTLLYRLLRRLPLSLVSPVVESYIVTFQKQ